MPLLIQVDLLPCFVIVITVVAATATATATAIVIAIAIMLLLALIFFNCSYLRCCQHSLCHWHCNCYCHSDSANVSIMYGMKNAEAQHNWHKCGCLPHGDARCIRPFVHSLFVLRAARQARSNLLFEVPLLALHPLECANIVAGKLCMQTYRFVCAFAVVVCCTFWDCVVLMRQLKDALVMVALVALVTPMHPNQLNKLRSGSVHETRGASRQLSAIGNLQQLGAAPNV